jgi:CheY-like chemotaxis protein
MADLNGLRVLVVEDEWLIASMIEAALASAHCEVVGPVGTLQQALERVFCNQFDAALVDLNLHGEMAYAVADALAEKGTPFLLVTSYEPSQLPEPYRACPRCGKPCPPHRLLAALSEVVAGQSSKPGSEGASGTAQT